MKASESCGGSTLPETTRLSPFMSESRSVIAYQRHLEASQKFDYFITGLTGALCAYIAQSWKPQKITPLGPEALELAALLLLFAAAVAGFKRIEWTVVTLRANTEWLHASERRGAMAGAVHESEGRHMFNAESGDFFSPFDALQDYKALSELTPEIRKKLDHASTQAGRWYKCRNRLLFVGFSVLVSARFAALL
jgi:hypothetical protein